MADIAVRDIRHFAGRTNKLGRERLSVPIIGKLSQCYGKMACSLVSLKRSLLVMRDAYPTEALAMEQLLQLDSLPTVLRSSVER